MKKTTILLIMFVAVLGWCLPAWGEVPSAPQSGSGEPADAAIVKSDETETITEPWGWSNKYITSLQNISDLAASGPSYWFDGTDDKIDMGGNAVDDGQITWEGWIRAQAFAEHDFESIYHNGKFNLIRQDSTDRIVIYSDGTVYSVSATNSVPIDVWYHVLITRPSAGTNTNIYLNGVLSGTANQDSGTPATGTTNDIIGSRDSGAQVFSGHIAGIKVHNRIFTATEAKSAYSGASIPYKYNGDNSSPASQTEATSGTLVEGKAYRINNWITADNFANVGGTNVDGTEFVAAGAGCTAGVCTPTTWAASSTVVRIGCVLDLNPSGITAATWKDGSGNGDDGTVSGAVATNLPVNIVGTTYGSDGSITDAELLFINTLSSNAQTQITAQEAELNNSAGLLAALSDETGTGVAVFNTSPTLVTPALGVIASGNGAALTAVDAATGDTATAFFDAGTVEIARLPSIDEDNMASDSAVHLVTQQSAKAYIDAAAVAPTNVTPVDNANEAVTFYLVMTDGATGSQATETDTGVTVEGDTHVLTAGGFNVITASPQANFDDSDGADGIISVQAADADDAVMSIGVDDSGGDDQAYVELDGVNERIEMKEAVLFEAAAPITMTGVAEGTDALTIALGDITLTDGDLNLTAGDAIFGEDVTITGVAYLNGTADLNDANITSVGDIAADSVSPDADTLEIGDADEETHIQADGTPDGDDTYSCGMVVWFMAGDEVAQFDLVMMQADGYVDQANASGVPIGFAVETNDDWPATAETDMVGVCLIGSGGVIRNDGWTGHTASEIVYTVDAGGTDGLFDPADEIDLEDGDYWTAVGVMQEEDIIVFPVPYYATDDGT